MREETVYAAWMPKGERRELSEEYAAFVHELQAPLTMLRVRIERALRASWCGPECRAVLEPCLDDLRNASRMIGDLLLLEEGNASEPISHQEPLDLEKLLSEASRDYLVLAESKGVSLRLDQLPAARVVGNAHQLRRVVANLLQNAVRHTPSTGTVRVRCSLSGGCADVRVIDEGPGIPREHQPRIFDRFYQIDRNADHAAGGVGLGLAIARKLAERNRAQLALESTSKKGSTFILRLPMVTKSN